SRLHTSYRAMVDRTVYANEAATPKLNLRHIFGRQGLDTGLCRLSADKGLLTVEMFAMLGQDLSSAKETLRKLWEADMSRGGCCGPGAVGHVAGGGVAGGPQEDHAEFRDRFVRVHPDVILIDAKEPHKKFVERLSRDFLIHGIVPFYEPAEIRTRADVIVVKSGLSRKAEDLLSISRADQPEPVTDVTTLFNRLHAFFMSLESSSNSGLPFLMAADRAIRKKIFRLLSEQRATYTAFSQALIEVLNNHKYLWNDARTSVTLSKVEHNRDGAIPPVPHNPFKRTRGGRKKKRLQKSGKEETPKKIAKEDPTKKPKRDDRIPEKEWKLIADAAKKVQGARRCHCFNSSLGCISGDNCWFKHLCMVCGAIAQELMAKKVPLLREEILQLASTSRIRDNIKQPASGAVLSLLAITRYIQQKVPEIVFTIHAVPNVVIKLSDFQGGGLWIEDPLGLDSQEIDGRTIQGTNTDFEQDTIVFNAKEALHMTLPWEGTRVVLAVYSVQGVDRIPVDEFEQLLQLGFKPAPVHTGDHADVPWQIPTFALTTEDADRKRPHGAPVRVREHRQRSSGQKAIAAGYQMKKSVVLPLITTEMHPGEAIEFALNVTHPFTKDAAIDADLQAVLQQIVDDPAGVCDRRASLLQHWDQRARALIPESDKVLKQIPDCHLRRLLRGLRTISRWRSAIGTFFHVALWRELLHEAKCPDVDLVDQILAGMPIVGDIASSHRWVADRKPHAEHLSVDSLRSRAWEFRCKVLSAIKRAPVTEHSPKVWESTLEDVEEGAAIGPFFEESEVSEFVGDDHRIPTQRFEVVQKNKVRGVDSATSNGINMATVVTEKLELPSTDANVAVIKWLRSRLPDKPLRGWVLDERRAYRQVPISPAHRKWSVVALKDPSTGKVHWWMGARFDQQKLQLCSDPTILGVTYDLEQYLLKIK
ncbi:unnamed protein product, partial [Symbiodinium necroappetens]